MHILAIDDDACILTLLEEYMKASGRHRVSTAGSARKALEAISVAERPFDCFFVDIQMPEVDGIVLTKLIRQTPGYERTPIIMLTAMNQKRYLDEAFEAGASDYLTKPIEFPELGLRMQNAQKAALEMQELDSRPFRAGEMKGMGDDPKTVRLEQSIPIRDIGDLIGRGEFENYVLRLAGRGLSETTIMAVKIDSVEAHHARMPSQEFKSLIRGVAAAVKQVLMRDGGIFCYRGRGTFLCANETGLDTARHRLEKALNEAFAKLHPQSPETPIRLVVGKQVPLDTRSDARTFGTLSQAVDEVEATSLLLRCFPEIPRGAVGHGVLSKEQQHLDRRVYQALMRDADPTTASDRWARRLAEREARAKRA